jgi:hypothetical protein
MVAEVRCHTALFGARSRDDDVRTMFLKSFTELPLSFDEVRASMLRRPRHWLEGLATAVERHGERLLVEVGLEVHGHQVSRSAWLEAGEPVTTDRVASLPFWLRVEDHQQLFPSLEGSIEAAWLGHDRTHLALTAQYEPPFGLLGGVADRALLHRVAEAVARRFLETVAERLAADSLASSSGLPLKAG